MQKRFYLGVKLIEATPINRADYNALRGWTVPADEDPTTPGYMVIYPDGYRSWSPADQFEMYYLPLAAEDGSKIMQEDIDTFMEGAIFESKQVDEKTTMVKIVPQTGFTQYEVSSCVDPKNYDHELGTDICTGRIMERFWPMLGFCLQWARFGLKKK